MTRAWTPESVASDPRGAQEDTSLQLGSSAGGGAVLLGVAEPPAPAAGPGCSVPTTAHAAAPVAATAAAPASSDRRRTVRRRSSTSAVGSGGSPSPSSRCSTAARTSPSIAHGAGSSSSAARAAACASTRRARTRASVAWTCAAGIPSRSATSSGPHPHSAPAATSARSRGDAARRLSTSASDDRVVVSRVTRVAPAGPRFPRRLVPARDRRDPPLARRRCDGRSQHPAAGLRHRSALVERVAPAAVQVGERRARRRPGGGVVEGDDEGDALEVGPASGHELAEVVLDGEGHRTSLTPAGAARTGLLRVSAARPRRPRRPRGCDSLAGSMSPVTSQMTRWPTLTAWSANRS